MKEFFFTEDTKVSSRYVADKCELPHSYVKKVIQDYRSRFEEHGPVISDHSDGTEEAYLLNQHHLVMFALFCEELTEPVLDFKANIVQTIFS